MDYDVLDILKNDKGVDLNNEFAIEKLIYIGRPLDVKKNKRLLIYKYDYLEITYLENKLYSLMFDELNYENEFSNPVVYKMIKPILGINLLSFKTLLNESKVIWNINKENTFTGQVCLETKSKWMLYFNSIDQIIRSANKER